MSSFNNQKRYFTQNQYLREKFGKKTIKLSLNAGMQCPNRDGKKGFGGCTYCSSMLSGDFSGKPEKSITEQLEEQKILLSKKWNDCLYIPYFQAGSNTYAPLEKLIPLFEEALSLKNSVGISVATRADCIDDDILCYLKELSDRTYLTVELGLQTIHDSTAEKINRCHTYAEFENTYNKLKNNKINTSIHIINGLPEENYDMMMETAIAVSKLKPHSIKIHMLHIIKNTVMAAEYEKHPFNMLTRNEYIKLLCDQLEYMNPEIIIERVTGDGKRDELIAPLWTADKRAVLNGIDKELRERNSYQGIKFKML